MSLTYQRYLLSMNNFAPDSNENLDLDAESCWSQYFDIESQTKININSKNNNYIQKPYIQFRELPANKFFKRKNPSQYQKTKDIDILESIKEEEPEPDKIQKNTNTYLCLINFQNLIVTSLIYISHLVLIVFLIKS